MRALIVNEPKAAPVIGERPEPTVGDGDALVELRAGGLNPVDYTVSAGTFPGGSPTAPYVPGAEGVGTVLRSTRFAEGTRVYASGRGLGIARDGAFSERFAVADEILIAVPEGVDDVTAAAFGVAGLAAWLPLSWLAPVRQGESVLVLGATGSVGAVAIQAAKALGAGRVVAVGRDPGKLDGCRTLGADESVSIAGDGFAERLAAAVADAPPTLIFDALWGPVIETVVALAPVGARIVNLGQSAGTHANLPSGAVRGKRLQILGYSNFGVPPAALAEGYRSLLEHVSAGRIGLEIETVPFAGIAEAWVRLAGGSERKLVLIP
jgi:NADPH:quinone reductase-like Zn-dependent oxidoreductase